MLATRPPGDTPVPPGTTQSLSFSSSATGVSCFLGKALGANYRYGGIAPIVLDILIHLVQCPSRKVHVLTIKGKMWCIHASSSTRNILKELYLTSIRKSKG